MNVLFLQFLEAPCVRSRKILHELNKHGFKVSYWGNKRSDAHNGLPFIRHFGIPCKRFSKLKPLLIPLYILHALIAYWLIPRSESPILYCVDLEGGIVGAVIKVFRSDVTFVYDVYDTYAIRYSRIPRLIRTFLLKLETFVANKSDLLVHVEKLRIPTLATNSTKRILVVRNVPLAEDLPDIPIPTNRILGSTFRILLSGGLFFHRGLRYVVDAVRELNVSSRDLDFEVVALGTGGSKEMEFIKQNSNVVNYLGVCSSAVAQDWSCKSDLIVSLYDPASPINRLACPNKVFDGLFNGTKILMNSELDISKTYANEPNFYFCRYGDIDDVKKAILSATEDMGDLLTLRAVDYRERMCWSHEFLPVINFLKKSNPKDV